MLRLALIGNPNSGKTTLFNLLTGSRARVGNFPGVTVERTSRALKERADVELTDLPGIYSLSPYSAEELVTRDFLTDERPDAVINIIDCTAAERGLYLTLQLLSLGLPTVVAFNMADELRAGGGRIDTAAFSAALDVPCIAVSALRKSGIRALTDAAVRAAQEKSVSFRIRASAPRPSARCAAPSHRPPKPSGRPRCSLPVSCWRATPRWKSGCGCRRLSARCWNGSVRPSSGKPASTAKAR